MYYAALACLIVGLSTVPTHARLRIVTTTADLAALASEVAGDLATVESIAKGYQDAHYIEAKPSFMRKLNRADLLIYTGLELEVAWLPLLIRGARNPRVVSGASGHLNTAAAVDRVIEIPNGSVDRSMGDVHPEGNPHYLLNPSIGLAVARLISDRLVEISPQNEETIREQFDGFASNLKTRITEWESRLAYLRGRDIVTYHKQWEYLTDWLGLRIIDNVESKPGIPPSSRHVASLVEMMNRNGIGILISANYLDPKAANAVAARTGARHLVLPIAPGGEDDIDTYSNLFEYIVSRIETAQPPGH